MIVIPLHHPPSSRREARSSPPGSCIGKATAVARHRSSKLVRSRPLLLSAHPWRRRESRRAVLMNKSPACRALALPAAASCSGKHSRH
jgi:hypothetical protein